MNWSTTAQIAVLVIAYVGGIAAICHYIGSNISNNIGKRIDSLETALNNRINDLRAQMTREHDNLASKVDSMNELLMEHIKDHGFHAN